MATGVTTVRDVPERSRFEIDVDGALVSAALVEARRRGDRILPFCPFVRSYLQRHPEYVDLVPEEHRSAFGLQADG